MGDQVPETDYDAGVPVILTGIPQDEPECTTVTDPNRLHQLIAETLLKTRQMLNADEIKFLRTRAGLRADQIPFNADCLNEEGSFRGNVNDVQFRLFIIRQLGLSMTHTDVVRAVSKSNPSYGRPRDFPLRFNFDGKDYKLLN